MLGGFKFRNEIFQGPSGNRYRPPVGGSITPGVDPIFQAPLVEPQHFFFALANENPGIRGQQVQREIMINIDFVVTGYMTPLRSLYR